MTRLFAFLRRRRNQRADAALARCRGIALAAEQSALCAKIKAAKGKHRACGADLARAQAIALTRLRDGL